MRFTVTAVLLFFLCSICPADSSSPGLLSIPDEASWLSYYSFRSSHPLLSNDALNGVLTEGHRLRLEAASAALSAKIADSPEDGFRSFDAMIDAAARYGLDTRAVFAPTIAALRAKLIEGKPEVTKGLESLTERLDATPSPSANSRSGYPSGYLTWLAARCGEDGEGPDAEYLKSFPEAPWNLGLLKFRGDLHYAELYDGLWKGEHCIFLGCSDFVGYFSGLGLHNLSEDELKYELYEAYVDDIDSYPNIDKIKFIEYCRIETGKKRY